MSTAASGDALLFRRAFMAANGLLPEQETGFFGQPAQIVHMTASFAGALERPTSISVQNRFPVLHLTHPAAETDFFHYSSPSFASAFVKEANDPTLHFCYGSGVCPTDLPGRLLQKPFDYGVGPIRARDRSHVSHALYLLRPRPG